MTIYANPKRFAPAHRQWPARVIQDAPVWCAVDLRDGNQALPTPLDPAAKKRFWQMLLSIGFKEIEVGFPAASIDEWNFCRNLIAENSIPEDVTISVLTQARAEIINRTMDALQGVKQAICHVYVATSELHRGMVLKETEEELRARVLESVQLIRRRAATMPASRIRLEFSPEEFTDSDPIWLADLCDDVVRAWNPGDGEKVIINLPMTVERMLPTHYPDMLEVFQEHAVLREKMILSIHAHNDMGGGVANTELGLLAGAERVEGTLFGNGERSGNADLITLALNLHCLGIHTGLDFSRLEEIAAAYTELTGLAVPLRQPYAGSLVFTAFSGSHQDAIRKVMASPQEMQERFGGWKVPYFQINPEDIGRKFKGSIRINSQSGKGGISYVLSENYGIQLPGALLAELAWKVQERAEGTAQEIRPEEIWRIFLEEYDRQEHPLRLVKYWPRPDGTDPSKIQAEVHLEKEGTLLVLHGEGEGPIAAFANAIRQIDDLPRFRLLNYEERSMGGSVNAEAITIVSMEHEGQTWHGIGFGANIVQGAAKAMISSLNRMLLHS